MGGTLVAVAAAIASVDAVIYGTRPNYSFWTSWPMAGAYAALGCAFACLVGASRDAPFPFATKQARENRPPVVAQANQKGGSAAPDSDAGHRKIDERASSGSGMTSSTPVHVFISYAPGDAEGADLIQYALEEAGVQVWRDSRDLWPGEDRRVAIRNAITSNAMVFIACFSSRRVGLQRSPQNEELFIALDEMRLRLPGTPWLIPVRFDDFAIPNVDIGAGRTLDSLESADIFGQGRSEAVVRLVAAVLRILRENQRDRLPQGQVERKQLSGSSRASGTRHRALARQQLWWTTISVLVSAAILAVAGALFDWRASYEGEILTGSVTCESGEPVEGVWIAASSGQSDSGFAHLGPADNSGLNHPAGPTVTYSYTLRGGGSYSVHVGCGGEASQWHSSNYSPELSGPVAHLECRDPTTIPPGGGQMQGPCVNS
jgi:TIR domain